MRSRHDRGSLASGSTMNRTLSIHAFLFLLLAASTAFAADQSIESALNHQYGGKTLALLHPIDKSSQVYDADGNVLKGGQEGSWTLFGRIFVKKIRVEKTSVLIEGQRLAYVQGRHDFSPVRSGGKLKVQINFTKAPSSADEATVLLGHVFALTKEDVANQRLASGKNTSRLSYCILLLLTPASTLLEKSPRDSISLRLIPLAPCGPKHAFSCAKALPLRAPFSLPNRNMPKWPASSATRACWSSRSSSTVRAKSERQSFFGR